MRCCRLIFAAAILLSSCSVKEERTGCPCLLSLDLDNVIETGRYIEAVATVGSSAGTPQEQELIHVASYKDVGYEVSVPRCTVNASVVCGCGGDRVSGESVDAGTAPVMAFGSAVHCKEDKTSVEVCLHKQYAQVRLQPDGYDPGDAYPFRARLNAATGSLALFDFAPCGEPFSVMFPEDLCVNLPRQNPGASLTIELLDDGDEPVYTVDLSAKLAASGFAWGAEDLADIVVRIDYAQTACSVEVRPWEENSDYRQIDI